MSDLIDKLKQLPEHPNLWSSADIYLAAYALPAIIARLESDAGEIARLRAERDGWQRQTEGLKRLIGHWSRLSPDAERVRDAYEVDPATLLSRHLNALAAALKEKA